MIRIVQIAIALVILSPEMSHAQQPVPRDQWTFKTVDDDPKTYGKSTEYGRGLLRPDNWRENEHFVRMYANGALPKKFDWREVVPGGLTPIRNQGNCGSCWAFSTAATFADMLKIKEAQTFDLSEQYIVSCNADGYSCNGGWWGHDLHQKNGWVKEADFPYQARDLSCKQNLNYQDRITKWATIGSSTGSPTVDELKQAIYQYGPISVTVAADDTFQNYKSGVFNACSSTSTNHMVNLVGWNDDEGAWIMRNSWGESWGERGYMRIKYNCNSIAEAATFIMYEGKCPIQPDANAGVEKTIRAGESVQIGGTPFFDMVYEWDKADGLSDVNSPNPVVKPTKTTVYSLKVKTSCGAAVSSVRVNVN